MNVTFKEEAARSWIETRFRVLSGQLEPLRRYGAKLGPFVLLELLMPGGTLLALVLLLYRRGKLNSVPLAIRLASDAALMGHARARPACHAT